MTHPDGVAAQRVRGQEVFGERRSRKLAPGVLSGVCVGELVAFHSTSNRAARSGQCSNPAVVEGQRRDEGVEEKGAKLLLFGLYDGQTFPIYSSFSPHNSAVKC